MKPVDHNSLEALKADLLRDIPASSILSDPELLDVYSRDHTSDLEALPHLVVRAENTEQVQAVMKACSNHNVPVTPRGAGSGVTGGSVPVHGGVVLSLEKMNRILDIDTDNMVAVVQPGAITEDIQNAALEQGLMYPPDPASLDICSIGGNVAENAGGPRAVKYGTTGDYVLSLECVLPDGSLIETGGRYVKNVTGYNLKGILIGSEGTLAIITKIILRLVPAPAFTTDLLIPFDTLEQAIDMVFVILRNRIQPSTMEFMERDAIALTGQYQEGNIPHPDAGAHLLVQLDGNSEDEINRQLDAFMAIESINHELIAVADGGPQREKLWSARRSIRHSIEAVSPTFLAEDCVVPRASIPGFIKSLKAKLNDQVLRSVMFGHAGDGNIHIDILQDNLTREEWTARVPEIKTLIYQEALSFQGTITGEHGMGYIRKEYLSLAKSKAEIELYRRIKQAFDPQGILNPGKVFPDE